MSTRYPRSSRAAPWGRGAALLLAAATLGATPACRKGERATLPATAPTSSGAPKPGRPAVIDATGRFDDCTLGHQGVLIDFGDPTARAALVDRAEKLERIEREGATWTRVRARSLPVSFLWLPSRANGDATPEAMPYAEARIRGAAAKSVSVFLNGKPLGIWTLAKNETRIAIARGGATGLAQGANELLLRFNGGLRAGEEPLAEIDWIHVGEGDPVEGYAAPTRSDALIESTLGNVAKRAVSLRAPGFVRCSGWVPTGASVEGAVAVVGGGEAGGVGDADVEVRLLRDRAEPIVLGTLHVTGGPSAAWAPISLPVREPATLAVVELAAVRASKGARVLFGEPRVVMPEAPTPPSPAPVGRNVVLVVLGALAPKTLGPYGGMRPMPELTELGAAGLVFDANRATAATANGAFASMMTGLPARVHTVEGQDARLPGSLTTLADAVRQAGIGTAMFTANPTTGAPFGFDHGWDTFVAHPPVGSTPGVQVFDDAAAWINEHRDKRFFVVVHARGGHPPWDVTSEELRAIALTDEAAELDPRRAAEFLARARRGRGLPEAIRTRAWALYNYAVDAHDAALGRLVGAVKAAGQERETTFIVTGDVSVSEGASIPFVDGEGLDESLLSTPLVVRPAGQGIAPRRVSAPTSSTDVARTVVDALGLSVPAAFKGADVVQIANEPMPVPRPLLATAGPRFSLRWGTFVLFGERDVHLCDLSLDPTCLTDVRETHPIAMGTLQRSAIDALAASPGPHPTREPVVLDVHTSEALRAWGRPPERTKGAHAADE